MVATSNSVSGFVNVLFYRRYNILKPFIGRLLSAHAVVFGTLPDWRSSAFHALVTRPCQSRSPTKLRILEKSTLAFGPVLSSLQPNSISRQREAISVFLARTSTLEVRIGYRKLLTGRCRVWFRLEFSSCSSRPRLRI